MLGVNGNAQQGSRRDDGDLRSLLLKIFQRRERSGARLDFVEEQERVAWMQLPAAVDGQGPQDSGGIQRALENGVNIFAGLEIEVKMIFLGRLLGLRGLGFQRRLWRARRERCVPVVFESGELFHQPCLPYLPGSLKDQRLAIRLQIPLEQMGYRGSFHGGFSRWTGRDCRGWPAGGCRGIYTYSWDLLV